jgi:hypothetical protein
MEIPLSKAPEVFFDQQLWQIFQSYFKTPRIALERISDLPQVPGYYYHREHDALPSSDKELWQEVTEAADLGKALLYGLQRQFLARQIIATGVAFGLNSSERVVIPPDRWLRLWPNFVHNFAMAQFKLDDPLCTRYDDIRLSSDDSTRAHAIIVEDCISFLQQRKADGEERKAVLEREAINRLGMPIPTRDFDAAFKAVFQRKRGRPRKKKK